jgi:hypothetical protein
VQAQAEQELLTKVMQAATEIAVELMLIFNLAAAAELEQLVLRLVVLLEETAVMV